MGSTRVALSVVIMGSEPGGFGRRVAPWGYWDVHGWDDPTELATDPYVLHPGTRQVLVLAPPAAYRASNASAATIAAQRPDIQVRVEQRPVSIGVLVRALERVPANVTSPTVVHAALGAALSTTTWGAWLPSVTKLEEPAPTMRQHLSSWFGGEGFLAVRGEPGWVGKLPIERWEPGHRLPRPPSSGGGPEEYSCAAAGELPEPAIAALFQMGLASRPQRRDPFGDAAAVWGSDKAVEFVITPGGAPDLGQPSGACKVCAEPVWGTTCPFCRIVLPGGTLAHATPGGAR
jgi:hypothetical protein